MPSLVQACCKHCATHRKPTDAFPLYSSESEYVRHDAHGQHHSGTQAEGGEQGDPMMPALFSFGQQPALHSVQAQFEHPVKPCMVSSTTFMLSSHRAECVPFTTCSPTTCPHMPTFAATKAKLEYGIVAAKSQQTFTPWDLQHGSATRHSPQTSKDSPCWGHPFAQRRTSKSSSRTPSTSTSLCWTNCPASLISKQHGCCRSTHPAPAATTYSGFFHPHQQSLSPSFAQNHDLAVARCLSQLLHSNDLPVDALSRAHLPLAMGGLGLMSASHLAIPAYWASWLHRQTPVVAANIQHQSADPSSAPPQVQAAHAAR